jgi:hypothetical protein
MALQTLDLLGYTYHRTFCNFYTLYFVFDTLRISFFAGSEFCVSVFMFTTSEGCGSQPICMPHLSKQN